MLQKSEWQDTMTGATSSPGVTVHPDWLPPRAVWGAFCIQLILTGPQEPRDDGSCSESPMRLLACNRDPDMTVSR